MFTGIIEELGRVLELKKREVGARITIACSAVLQDAAPGSSIAINGACLTAVSVSKDHFSAELAPETLKRTNLGDLKPGSLANLERPLRATGRLGGHFVLGHVDGTGEILALEALGDANWWLRIRIPQQLSRYVVYKGSLAVDGISLTVAEVDQDVVGFTIIPHTWANTNLHTHQPGARVNLEADILAKYVEKLLASGRSV